MTPSVLFRAGKADELVDCLKTGSGLQDLLDTVLPGWRISTRLEWDVVVGPDGTQRWFAGTGSPADLRQLRV